MKIKFKNIILLSILSIVLFSIFINSFIFGGLINNYFKGYILEEYNNEIEKIKSISVNYLENNELTKNQIILQFENFIEDPIAEIELYDDSGNYILGTENTMTNMHNRMMNMRNSDIDTETDIYSLEIDEVLLGYLEIKRNMKIENTENINYFYGSLIRGSLVSIFVVSLLAIIISIAYSKRISFDFKKTVELANQIDHNEEINLKESKIKEIKEIQNTLSSISTKLKIKRTLRKEELDKLTHEIKTPIMILKSNLEGKKDGVVDFDKKRINSLIEEVDNLSKITENIKEIFEYEKNNKKLNITTFNLNEEIKKIYKGMKYQFEKKNIELEFVSNKKIEITSDKSLLNQSIYNLLSNAYKYSNSSKVLIKIEEFESKVDILIKDNGKGIDKKYIKNIFEAYYRVPTEKIGGSGLGLFITKNNIEKINGTIKVESDKHQGTKFIIELPKNIKS
ncbi:MAG: sensor histidine kinase [Thermotogota bacterium]